MPQHAHYPLGMRIQAMQCLPSPDGLQVVVGSAGNKTGRLALVGVGAGGPEVQEVRVVGGGVRGVAAVHAQGVSLVLACTSDGQVGCSVAKERMLAPRRSWRLHSLPATCVAGRPGGEAACGSESGAVAVWQVEQEAESSRLQEASGVTSLVFHPSEQQLVSGAVSGHVRVWDVRSGRRGISVRQEAGGAVQDVALHPARPFVLATACSGGQVGLWDLRMPAKLLCCLREHQAPVWQLQFHPTHPDHLFSCGEDGAMLLWDFNRSGRADAAGDPRYAVADTSVLSLPSYSTLGINCFALSPDCSTLVYGSDNEALHVLSGLSLRGDRGL